ncbi:PhoU domain-containing protein [Desulfococcus sp.]|uniref:PhoU domain-containing protein n=1 Tax=Desulfococcus sp. TaxID=2025834 RepID=UPI00359355BA
MEIIKDNFRFLAIEAESQVKLTYGLLTKFDVRVLEKIASKDDYIDNLKTTIENECFSSIHSSKKELDQKDLNDIRALHVMSVNLERIADYCVNIGRQTRYLSSIDVLAQYDYKSMFSEIQKALTQISRVFAAKDLSGALAICRSEFHLDALYKQNFDRIMADLETGRKAGDLVTAIFIFRYLERIGDSLLNIGEALIFSIIGDRIKIRQVEALEKTLSESGFEGNLWDIDFSSIWGSRSGCRISRVGRKKPSGFKSQGIFKEGDIKKIKGEYENIRKWDEILPGLAPGVFGYYEKTVTASMLVEFLSGCTLEQVILTEKSDIIRNVIFIFEQTVGDVWRRTLQKGAFQTDYMEQLQSRLEAVHRVHPEHERPFRAIGSLDIPATVDLIAACARIERGVPAPFTVFIHGDFNTNNIVYNHEEQKINYIDLYRSKQADYIQDVSVFLVSNFRLPVFDVELRERLNTVSLYFHEFFSDFAEKNTDPTFEVRLALALARSFYTSTRFEMEPEFAREMALRAHYLMERVAAHEGRPWEAFRLPQDVLFY